MKSNVTGLLILVILPYFVFSQESGDKNDLAALLLNFQYGFQIPAGDWTDTYGNNNILSASLDFRFPKSNFGISAGADYLFGRDIKQDVLQFLRTERGYIIGTDGLPADVFLRQRGINGWAALTWSNDFLEGRDKFGLYLSAGGGFMTHWIRIQDERQSADQIRGSYSFGYDRRRFGYSTRQFVGVQYLSFNKRINFTAGFDFTQAWTKSIRPWNFDTMEADESTQLDLLQGFRIGWIIPVYFSEPTEHLYY